MTEFPLVRRDEQAASVANVGMGRYPEMLLESKVGSSSLSLADLVVSAWRHRITFMLTFIVTFGVATAVIFSLEPSYQAEASLMIDPRQSHITDMQSVMDGSVGTLSDLNFVRTEMQVLSADDLARSVILKMKLQDSPMLRDEPGLLHNLFTKVRMLAGMPEPQQSNSDPSRSIYEAVSHYKRRFGTFTDGKSFIISAWFNAPDPVLAQEVLQTHMGLFQAQQIAFKREAIARAERWFDNELTSLQAKLLTAEAKEQTFKERNELLRTSGETAVSRQLTAITNQLSSARSDLGLKEARLREISTSGTLPGRLDTAAISSDLVQKLRVQQSAEAQSLAQLAQRYESNFPAVVAARAALSDIQTRIDLEIQRITTAAASDLAIARSNVAQLELSQVELTARLGTTSNGELSASQLKREVDAERRLYDDLLSRSKQVAIQQQLQEPDTRVVSAASLPLQPNFPRKGMLFAVSASVAAFAASVASVLLGRLRGRRSRGVAQVEGASGLPTLAVVPHVKKAKRPLGVIMSPGSPLAAAFQTLHNSITFRTEGAGPEITVFASAIPSDGKSLTSLLYARFLASLGNHVLLIDADLRRAGLSRALNLHAEAGTIACLEGRPLASCIVEGVVRGLDLLSAKPGEGDPAALLSREKVRSMLSQAEVRYTAVVIDVPPILVVDDCLNLAAEARTTLLVARSGRTPLTALTRAVKRFRVANVNVVGVIMSGGAAQDAGAEGADAKFNNYAITYR